MNKANGYLPTYRFFSIFFVLSIIFLNCSGSATVYAQFDKEISIPQNQIVSSDHEPAINLRSALGGKIGSDSAEAILDVLTEDAQLTTSDGDTSDWFGHSVAISGDTIVIGAVYDDNNTISDQGSAYVFEKPITGWETTWSYTAKLTASDGVLGDQFGSAVAISEDTIVIGAFADNNGEGSTYVFIKPTSGWETTSNYDAKLTASDGVENDLFGCAVAISGGTIVVGAGYDDNNAITDQGSAYVFEKPASGWETTSSYDAKLTTADGSEEDHFGRAVTINEDTIVIGAGWDDINTIANQGSAYVFEKPISGWVTTSSYTAKLTASDGAVGDFFGLSVAIGGDMIVVGANNEITDTGSAYVFEKSVLGWETTSNFTTKLIPSDIVENDGFGRSVSISGDTVVVGSNNEDVNSNSNQGSAYVFVKPSSGWDNITSNSAKLIASDGAADDGLGVSVAISGNTIVTGAPFDDVGTHSDQGSVYIFEYEQFTVNSASITINGGTSTVYVDVNKTITLAGTITGTGNGTVVYRLQYRDYPSGTWQDVSGLDQQATMTNGTATIDPSVFTPIKAGSLEYRILVNSPSVVASNAIRLEVSGIAEVVSVTANRADFNGSNHVTLSPYTFGRGSIDYF